MRATLAAAWLGYRQLRYYPVSLVLAAVQQLTGVGVWYFVGRFLQHGASASVAEYGGNYVAFVLIGVMLNQAAFAAVQTPFRTLSDAFWDKRLEAYRMTPYGLWANLVGRTLWEVGFACVLQAIALGAVLWSGAIPLHHSVSVIAACSTVLLLIVANAGIGFAGASLFFLLEVKVGQDPTAWLYRYLVMLASGIYVPLGLLPAWLRLIGETLPQTLAFNAMRSLLLTGAPWGAPAVAHNLLLLALEAAAMVAGGVWMMGYALNRAERGAGVGVIV